MIGIIDVNDLGLRTLPLDVSAGDADNCSSCVQYRTTPQLDGNLQVDPEIHLPSPGMNVDIAYYYNSNSTFTSGPTFGLGRTISTNLLAQASGTPLIVSLTRGNGNVATYLHDGGGYGTGNFASYTQRNANTLERDSSDPFNPLWKETTPDGMVTAYPADTSGQVTQVVYKQDAVGNRHTFSYSVDGLETLQDTLGRKVTFGYDGNGYLENIEDWSGRRTTFAYDTSLPDRPVLSQVTGPTGCQTFYGYDDGARLNLITDPNGYTTTYTYDRANRVVKRSVAGTAITRYEHLHGRVVITQPNGAIVTNMVDSQWNQAGVEDATGVRTTLVYDERGLVIGEENYYGARTSTTYDSNNLPTSTVNALGQTTGYSRDAYGNLTAIATPDGTITTMIYGYGGSPFDTTGAKRRLQAQIDALGNRTSYSYNGRGQLTGVQDALGYRTTYTYDANGNQQSIVNALGFATTMAYDLAGNVIEVQDALGNRTSYSYDARNRATETIDALGNRTTIGYDSVGKPVVVIDALGNRTTTTYNIFGQPLTVQDALGNITSTVYDVQGRALASIDALLNRTSYSYDAAGRVVAVKDPLNRTTSTFYDKLGRPQASLDALGNRTTTIYDVLDRPIGQMDELGFLTTTSYDSAGRPEDSIDALGRITTAKYDAAGRLQATVDAAGYRWTTTYDAVGRSIAKSNPLARISTSLYDAVGNLTASVDPLGFRTSYGYDALGRQIRQQSPTVFISSTAYDARGMVAARIDGKGHRTSYVYDAAGNNLATLAPGFSFTPYTATTFVYDPLHRRIAEFSYDNARTSYTYDAAGRKVSVQNALGFRTTNVFDAVGQMTAQQNALGFLTTLSYDALGRKVAVWDAVGNITTMAYDARSHLRSTQTPWGSFVTNSYDAIGNSLTSIDGRGFAVTMSYDALGHLSGTLATNGALTTYLYDAAGQEVAVWNDVAVVTNVYDAAGRVKAVAALGIADTVQTIHTYSYDGSGNRTLLVDLEGHRTTYIFGAYSLGYQAGVQGPYEANSTLASFDARGKLLRRTHNNNLASDEGVRHDPLGRELNHGFTQPDGTSVAYQTNIDIAGRRSTMYIDHNLAHTTFTYFTYDGTDQLLSERRVDSPGYAHTYTYDGVGNRLTRNSLGVVTTYSYFSGNRLATEQTGATLTTYSYDQAGNLNVVAAGAAFTTYSWDTDNRLASVNNPDGSNETYSYGADGLRRRKAVTPVVGSPVITNFDWDGQQPYQERNENGLLLAQYTAGPQQTEVFAGPLWDAGSIDNTLFLQRRANTPGDLAGGTSTYFGPDESGNIRLLFSSTGAITDNFVWKAFGEQFARTGSTISPFGFGGALGYYQDAVSRLYVRARHLDTASGRWISRDPIGFDGGDWNLYRYVGNDPVSGVDPSGLYSKGQCFNDWFAYFRKKGKSSIGACVAAKATCGAHVDCSNQHFVFDTTCRTAAEPMDCEQFCNALVTSDFLAFVVSIVASYNAPGPKLLATGDLASCQGKCEDSCGAGADARSLVRSTLICIYGNAIIGIANGKFLDKNGKFMEEVIKKVLHS